MANTSVIAAERAFRFFFIALTRFMAKKVTLAGDRPQNSSLQPYASRRDINGCQKIAAGRRGTLGPFKLYIEARHP